MRRVALFFHFFFFVLFIFFGNTPTPPTPIDTLSNTNHFFCKPYIFIFAACVCFTFYVMSAMVGQEMVAVFAHSNLGNMKG